MDALVGLDGVELILSFAAAKRIRNVALEGIVISVRLGEEKDRESWEGSCDYVSRVVVEKESACLVERGH